MKRFLVRFACAATVVLAGCDDVCTLALPICGLRVTVSGLAAQETVTISVKAEQEANPHTFTCTAQNGTCSQFFQDYAPEKVTVQVNRNGVMTARTLDTTKVKNGAGCSSCTGAKADVAL